ncbi:MAG: phenylalanine--tRNA ligase subunit beta [Bacillota bacterium]
MKLSYNWLQSYIDFPFSPEELAHELTMTGLEVEGIEYLGKELEGVVIGRITEINDHPNADKLVICQVDAGKETVQVVTGAPNVKEGIMVPLAPAGVTLPPGKVEETNLRGKMSEGMICSKDELGLMEERADGIMVLSEEAEEGDKFIEYMGLDDYVLEFDLTPNYAHCLGVLGVAREVKALLAEEKEIAYPEVEIEDPVPEDAGDYIDVSIEDPELCPRYTARIIRDVEIKPSPEWMQQRLRAAGIRPINNIVDITNYVLLEYNQPLHAFDYDKVAGKKIIVRRAEAGETLLTLDGEERDLDEEMLVIADRDKPTGLAGVMGGAESEVTEETDTILLEAAFFKPENIRKTSRRLGLRSEASHRFERGIDIENVAEASRRACQLFEKYAGGKVLTGLVDSYPRPYEQKEITLNVKRVNNILGIELKKEEIVSILEGLEFTVKDEKGAELSVSVPSFRRDVSLEADLIEEVARIHGYNKIPVTRSETTSLGKTTLAQKTEEYVSEIARSAGLDEAYIFSLIDREIYDELEIPADSELRNWVELKSPLTEAFSLLRTSLIPGIVRLLSDNVKRQMEDVRVFEVGRVFFDCGVEERPEEQRKLAAGVTGAGEDIWNNNAPEFFYLKGVIETIFTRLNIGEAKFTSGEAPYLHPGRTAVISYDGNQVGILGELAPAVRERFDIDSRAAVFQLDLDFIIENAGYSDIEYISLTRYPSVRRDLAVVVEREISTGKILAAIRSAGGELLQEVELFDHYQGEQIPAAAKSLAYELTFQAPDRTLTDEEVNERFNRIVERLNEDFGAEIRRK